MSAHVCRICGHGEHVEIFARPRTPLFIGILGPTTPAELRDRTLPIALVRCARCNTIQQPVNPAVDALLDQVYHASHENACSGTRTGEGEFGRQRAHQFLDGVSLKRMPDRVLEIGCNQGHMLAMCKDLGAGTLVGVEPSAPGRYSPSPGIDIIPGYFDRELLAGSTFDLAYMIEVLEHIPSPTKFLDDVRSVLRPGGRLAVSVPNCHSGIEFGNIGMPIHEHLLYFTPHSLKGLMERAGFEVLVMKATFSHLYCLAQVASSPSASKGQDVVDVSAFWPACEARFDKVAEFARAQTEPWGLYGACSLTANLVAWAGDIDLGLCKVVDADRNKWGRTVSGCPGETISPADAVQSGVRRVVVMPFGFQENIRAFIQEHYPDLQPTLLYEGLAAEYAKRESRASAGRAQ